MVLQAIFNIAEVCAKKNLQNIILSPGSRNAPLAIAFVRHLQIKTLSLSDERAAGFTALGMANQFLSRHIRGDELQLVGISCTSGSAAYNYAPAVSEAFFQQIPLLVLTADRPPEWIDQLDGQTIRQRDIYGKHIKASYELPADYSHPDSKWFIERTVNEAINLAKTAPFGPVHINIPFREPFYPEENEEVKFEKNIKIIELIKHKQVLPKEIWNQLLDIWESTEKKLVVVGQNALNPTLLKALHLFYQDYKIPIVGDIISNVQSLEGMIKHQDIFLMNKNELYREKLRPDLLITFGKSLISKNLKLFLRQYKAPIHWHIQAAGQVADTFQSLTQIIPVEPAYFFAQLFEDLDFLNLLGAEEEDENPYNELWQAENRRAEKFIHTFFRNLSNEKEELKIQINEFQAVGEILDLLPAGSLLHLANSMAVRYASYFGLPPATYQSESSSSDSIEVFANRGTSGIDGCTSTAVGAALAAPDKVVTLISGDVAFFYDRNALWNNYLPANLRIILLNNHGGNIFRLIDGPNRQAELDEYFETYQLLNAENTAKDFRIAYHFAKDWQSLKSCLDGFFEASNQAKILEIETAKKRNAELFKNFKREFEKSLQKSDKPV